MHINRLRLLGFKSFVEPTELLIEKGLTGVVGPNGCGKSNLLEALRWVMGETSHKSMRAAAMDDVIFSGTPTRPPRNTAEVTIFIDNTDRKAPAEFNGNDTLEVTRRIEREAGSAYRINGREVRARDVRILFEDAATGARSPALVRQGQIGEIVNAKPEQRRRILEDAAGIAGLHSRRHEAELRLRAAEGNLARLNDILGQLNSQIESLKRQARQARRYKEIVGRDPQARGHRLAICSGRRRRARSTAEEAAARRGAGEGRARHRGRGQGGLAPRRRPPGSCSRCASRRLPRAPSCIASRSSRRTWSARRSAPPTGRRELEARVEQLGARSGARGVADRRGQGNAGAPRGGDGVARQHRPPGRRFRAEGAGRLRRGRSGPQGRRGAAQRAHHGYGRSARAPPEPGDAAARAPGADRQARAPADGARRADPRDRRPRARCLQAEGRRRERPAADGRDRRDRGRDARGRGSRAGRGRRRQGQERGCRRGRAWLPASSRPRSRRWPSC